MSSATPKTRVGPSVLATRDVISHVYAYLKPLWVLMGVAIVLVVANRGVALSVPVIASHLIDRAAGVVEGWTLNQTSVLLVGLFVVAAVCQFVSQTLFAYVSERVVMALRRDVLARLLSLSVDFFEHRRVGELMSRVASDATLIQTVGTRLPMQVVREVVTMIGGLTLVWVTNASLTLLLFMFMPLIALTTFGFGRLIRRLATDVQDQTALSSVVVAETLSGIETVKSFAREEHEVARYHSRLRGVFRSAMRHAAAAAGLMSSSTLIFSGGLCVVLSYAAGMIQSGEITTGDLVAFMAYTILLGHSFSAASESWARWQLLIGAGRRVFQLLGEVPTVRDRPDAQPFDGSHRIIALENVRFAYPTHPEREILRDVSFSIERGQTVALVGESGAGKSTVVSLLLRHYDVTGGAITIDGRDLRILAQRDLREAIALVPQDVVVFGRSLRENIAYGDLEAGDDEILAAARAAHALEFIERTPQGFDTMAGERGVMLSGGEKQRLAIARALLKDPAILVLDEATSSLDTESERLVGEAFDTLMKGRTTLVIAHRLSTIERADRVVVLHRGEVVEMGTHPELLAKDGRYARLYRRGFDDD